MELEEYLSYLQNGGVVEGGSELHQMMYEISHQAMRITAQLNSGYHPPEEIRVRWNSLLVSLWMAALPCFRLFIRILGKTSPLAEGFLSTAAAVFRIREVSPLAMGR